MLRKCLLCLAAFLLLFTLAAAETAEEAAPAENPFIGVWQIAYYIHEGKLVTDPMTVEGGLPTMIEFHEETLTVHYPDGDHNEAACEYMGNTCSAWGGSSVFTLEGKDLIICREGGLSFILTRIDPLVLNNPFIGTWIPLCAVKGHTVRTAVDQFQEASAVFGANSVELIDGKHVDVYSCTYADGSCILLMDDERIVCTITEDGLLHMTYPVEGQIICAREGEVLPENTTQFFGEWREIAALRSGLLITDQMPQSQRPFENNWLFQYDFSRAAVLRSCPEHADNPSSWILCTYADGTCTILYDDMPVQCTIDENGLMCIRSEDGDVIWLVRVEEETDAEPAASK